MDANRERSRGLLALLLVQLFFGLFPVFGKLAFGDFSPRSIAAWRIVVASLALLAVAFARHGRRALPARGDLARLALCSLLGVALNIVLFLEGLERSTALNAGLIITVIPVFTFLIAALARAERFDGVRGAGILLAFAGILLLLFQKGTDLRSEMALGNALMVINCLCYAVYLVIVRPLMQRLPALVVIGWVFALSLWTVPLLAGRESWFPAASARSWFSMAYILLFPTVLAYLLNGYALRRVSSSTTATFIFLQPLITGSMGVLVLGERLRAITMVAAALTLAGVWIVVRRPAPTAPTGAGVRIAGDAGTPSG